MRLFNIFICFLIYYVGEAYPAYVASTYCNGEQSNQRRKAWLKWAASA